MLRGPQPGWESRMAITLASTTGGIWWGQLTGGRADRQGRPGPVGPQPGMQCLAGHPVATGNRGHRLTRQDLQDRLMALLHQPQLDEHDRLASRKRPSLIVLSRERWDRQSRLDDPAMNRLRGAWAWQYVTTRSLRRGTAAPQPRRRSACQHPRAVRPARPQSADPEEVVADRHHTLRHPWSPPGTWPETPSAR
jgi:hypothetical protein